MKGNFEMKYLTSFLIVSIATIAQWWLWPFINPAPFLLFYPAIVLAALYGEGLSAIFLSSIAIQLFFVSPTISFQFAWPGDVVRISAFIVSGLMIRHVTNRLAIVGKKAQEAELWLSTTLASIGDAVITTDQNGKISFMNLVAEGLTEWSLADAKGKALSDVFHIINKHTREVLENPVSKVMAGAGVLGLASDTVLVGRKGKESNIEDSVAPIRISGNEPIQGVVFVFRDATEKYIQENKLAETFEKLQSSENRMRNILENALDAVVSMDDRGLITHWNPQAEKVFGFKRAEAVGRRMSEAIIPHRYREAHERGMKHYLASGEGRVLNRRIEITALRSDGSEFPIELSITPIKVGQQMSFAAFIRDISEQQRLKRELLLKSEALENSLNGFDIIDEKGRFVYANRAYLSMWGYDSLDEVLATSPVSHCADPTMPEKIIGQLKEKGECDIEFVARRKDGSKFDVRMWARLAHDSEGTEVYPSTTIDITERKIAERNLNESKEAAEKANRAKSQFLANMSHEIRTPIGIIQGFAELLNEFDGLPPDQKQWVQTISRNSRLLTNVVGEILDLSRVEANMLEIERVVFPLADVIDDISASMQFKAEEKGIVLSIEVDENVPSMIHSDPTRLR